MKKPAVLMIDIGGSNVKLRVTGSEEMRRFASSRTLTPAEMVEQVRRLEADWTYDAVSIGFPGLIKNGRPIREPLNLGGGWLDFDYEKAFGKAVRMINDAALQALAVYRGGRMLFIGFGTSIGCGLVADGTVITMEMGMIPLGDGERFMDRLNKAALKERGVKRWTKDVNKAVALLKDIFWPDDTVIGGGNAKHLDPFPENCRQGANHDALRGAERLWPGSDLFAEPCGTTLRVTENAAINGVAAPAASGIEDSRSVAVAPLC